MGAWIHASIVFGNGSHLSQFLAVGPANARTPSLTGRIGRHHTSNRHDHQRVGFRPLVARDVRDGAPRRDAGAAVHQLGDRSGRKRVGAIVQLPASHRSASPRS